MWRRSRWNGFFDRVIPRGALTLLAGDSGVGKKAVFAVGLIEAMLRGQPGPRCRVIAGTDDRGLKGLLFRTRIGKGLRGFQQMEMTMTPILSVRGT